MRFEEVKIPVFAAKNAAKTGHPVHRGVGLEARKARFSRSEKQPGQNWRDAFADRADNSQDSAGEGVNLRRRGAGSWLPGSSAASGGGLAARIRIALAKGVGCRRSDQVAG